MRAELFLPALLGLLSGISTVIAGEGIDPLNNFCSRWYHQSQVKDGVIIISGGIESFSDRSNIQYGSQPNWTGPITTGPNDYLVTIQMQGSWDWKSNISEVVTAVSSSSSTGTKPPIVQNAALFQGTSNDTRMYLYGGVTPTINTSFPLWQWPTSNQYTLWAVDTNTTAWTQYSVFSNAPERPSWGARAEVPDLGKAFYFNGMITNYSSPSTSVLGSDVIFLESMVVLDLNDFSATNLSTSTITNGSPRVGGEMIYVPGLGTHGVLIMVGGASGTFQNLLPSPMDSIFIFDVASILDPVPTQDQETSGWFVQATSGEAPDPRVDFCLVLQSAPDNSSHNIYLYGGWDPTREVFFDEVWILSLPSFTWINVYKGTAPRFGHTCHPVGNRQMITIGGLATSNYSQACDWEYMSVAILDMSSFIWGSVYDAFDAPYTVLANISRVIGGDANGNATKQLPDAGWTSQQLALVMTGTSNQSAPVSGSPLSSNTTISSNSSQLNTRAIGGGIGGGLAAILVLIFALDFYRRKFRKPKTDRKSGNFDTTRPKPPFEMDEMHDQGHGPYNSDPKEMAVNEISPREMDLNEIRRLEMEASHVFSVEMEVVEAPQEVAAAET